MQPKQLLMTVLLAALMIFTILATAQGKTADKNATKAAVTAPVKAPTAEPVDMPDAPPAATPAPEPAIQPVPAADAPPAATPAPAPAPATAQPATSTVVPGSNADLVAKLKELKAAVDKVREPAGMPLRFAIAGLIAVLANLLLSLIKRIGGIAGKGKKILPWAAMGLGVVVGVASYYAGGKSLTSALIYGGGAPFAIVLQELFGLISSKEPATTPTA